MDQEAGDSLRQELDAARRRIADLESQLEQRLNALAVLDQAGEGFVAIDPQLTVTFFNRTAANLLHRDAKDVLGKHLFDEAFPEGKGSVVEKNCQAALSEQRTIAFETYFSTAPYANWFEVRLHPAPHGLSAFFQIITPQREAEEAARKSEEQLRLLTELQQHENEMVQAQLARVQDRLVRQTRLATLGQVSGSVAHELRNPLGLIRNALYMLRRQFPAEVERCARLLTIIDDATADADRTITELVAMSRGEPPSKQVVDLKTVFHQTQANYRRAARLRWEWQAEPEPFLVEIDPSQFEQVFRNLASNSIEASARTIQVQACRTAAGDEIIVSDDGTGIPTDRRADVFEPLYTTKRLGTGLGLTICEQIVRRHGGTIELMPTPQGAAFLIRLPSAS